MLRHGRSNSHSGEHAHTPVHVVDPRRRRHRDSDDSDLIVRSFLSSPVLKHYVLITFE